MQIPENAEVYMVTLLGVTGGSSVNPSASSPEINPDSNSLTITIRANDAGVKFEQVSRIMFIWQLKTVIFYPRKLYKNRSSCCTTKIGIKAKPILDESIVLSQSQPRL